MKSPRTLSVACVYLVLFGWAAVSAQTSATVQTTNDRDKDAQPPADAPPAPPARSGSIPPSLEQLQKALAQREQDARERAQIEGQIERARQNLEKEREAYEAAAHPDQAAASRPTAQPVRARKPPQLPERRPYELFGGYSLLFDTTDGLTFPLGWIASVSRPLDDSAAIVGEVTGSYKSGSALGVTLAGQNIHTFAAGVRLSRRTTGILAYGQLLAGLEVASAQVFGYSDSSTGFVLEPGFGVDVPVARNLGVRVGGEFTIVRDSGAWFNGFRLTTGFVVISKR
jgi:hypothetical protein